MADASAIGGAVAAINLLRSMAQSMIALRDAEAFKAKLWEFQNTLLDAQNRMFAVNEERTTLIERVSTLEAEIANLKAWNTEKNRYELKSIDRGAATVFMLKPAERGTEPPHWLCPTCYEKGRKGYFQMQAPMGRSNVWACSCGTKFLIDRSVAPQLIA